ncbi:MAG TPA: response regulator [Candidatus Kapabacteria bacterium]|nr:response regulator [Candidatus Kapabacteria bacterium]
MSEQRSNSTNGKENGNAAFANKNLLIVEDYDRLRALMAKPFERAGFTVYSATSPLDVLSMAKSLQPDIVILDQALSCTSAMLLLKMLRAQLPDSIVIMYATGMGPENKNYALQNGATDVLMQDYDPAILDRLVTQASFH